MDDDEFTLRRTLVDDNVNGRGARERAHAPCTVPTESASVIPITRRRSCWLDPGSPQPQSTTLGSTSAASAPFTLDTTSHRSIDTAPVPDEHLPQPILTPTNVHEHEIYVPMYAKELVHRLVNNKTTVELSWRPRCLPRSGQPFTELLCVFVDKRGSLSAITSTLASLKINILGLSAFSTDTGIAIDTFEVDRFDESAAMSLIACMDGLYFFSSNLPTPRMLVSPSLSPSSSPSASLRGGDSFVEHMSELSRSARPRQTERGSAVAAHRFTSLLRNLAVGLSDHDIRHRARQSGERPRARPRGDSREGDWPPWISK